MSDAAKLRTTAWGLVAACVAGATLAYPIAAGATLCVDDFVWILISHGDSSLVEALRDGWRAYPFFRIFDIGTSTLVDGRSLAIWPIIVIQCMACAWCTQAIGRMMRICSAWSWTSWLAAVTWLLLHPATQVSLWSAGTLSQTLSAAAGMWLLAVILEAATTPGRRVPLGTLCALSCVGILAKELFLGWATCGVLLLLAVAWRATARGGATWPHAFVRECRERLPQALAIIGPPIVFLATRVATSQLGVVGDSATESRYSFHGPEALVRNVVVAVVGMFAQGQVHWARMLGLPWSAVPFVGAAVSFLVAAYGGRVAKETLARAGHPVGSPLLVVVAAGLCTVWPALIIGHFSELYVMGANALVAVLIGIGVDAATTSSASRSTRALVLPIAVMYAIAVGGAVSRAYHFGVTWSHARAIRDDVQAALDHAPAGAVVPFSVPESLRSGPTHSKYIVPPVVAANPPRAFALRKAATADEPTAVFDWPVMPPGYEGRPIAPDPPLVRREMW